MLLKKIIIPYLISISLLNYIQYYIYKKQIKNDVSHTMNSIDKTFSNILSLNFEKKNKDILYAYMEGISNNDVVSGMAIFDNKNIEYASMGIIPELIINEQYLEYTYNLFEKNNESSNSRMIGTVHFYTDTNILSTKALKIIYAIIIQNIFIVLFLIIILYYFERENIIYPFNQIRMSLKNNEMPSRVHGLLHYVNEVIDYFYSILYDYIEGNKQLKEQYEVLDKKYEKEKFLLSQSQRDLKYLAQYLDQGIFTINRKFMVDQMYSKKCLEIYNIESMNKIDIKALFLNNTTMLESEKIIFWATIANALGEDIINYEFNEHLLPRKYEKMINGKYKLLEFKWKAISIHENNMEVCDKIMIFVKEINNQKL